MANISREDVVHLPQAVDAEKQIIGACLMDPQAVYMTIDKDLDPDDFYTLAYGWLYGALRHLAVQGKPCTDLTSVNDAMEHTHPEGAQGGNLSDIIGGPAALTGFIIDTPTTVHVATHVKLVQDKAELRRFIGMGGDIARMAHEFSGDDISELRNDITTLLLGATQDRGDEDPHLYPDDPRQDYEATMRERAAILAADPYAYIRTGLPRADMWFKYLRPGTLTVFGAKPGVGKTMLLEQIAEFNARHGKYVTFYHFELDGQFMMDRRMARYSGITQNTLADGGEYPEVGQAEALIDQFRDRLFYCEAGGWDAERIAADMMRHRAMGQCDLVIVDYLQLIKVPKKGPRAGNLAEALGYAAGTIKIMATKLRIPVIFASQVKRTDSKRPSMEDLRSSGEIEMRANQVCILHRPEEPPEGAAVELVEMYVEKNTTGNRRGKIDLHHRLGSLMFTEAPDEDQQAAYQQSSLDRDREFKF